MLDMLPHYYKDSQVIKDFLNSIQEVFKDMDTRINNAEKEINIITAEDLSAWENEVGLTSLVDADKETRRSRVLTRLQGNGVLTVAELIALVAKYEDTEIQIKEDYENYTVSVIFPKRLKAPEKLEQIRAAVEEVKPAHIRVIYTFSEYATHLSLQQYKHGELRKFTHYQLRNEILSHDYNHLGVTSFKCFVLG